MKVYFNELSEMHNAPDVDTAHRWLNMFFELGKQFSIRRKEMVSIVTTKPFKDIYLNEGTSFTNWIKTIKDVEFKRLLLSMLTKHPLLDYPFYTFNSKPCHGMGFAFENNELCLSYGQENWPSHEIPIFREQFDDQEDVEIEELIVKHISKVEHLNLYCPERIFKHNPKHDRVRPLYNKGEVVSILECSFENADKLLRSAIGESTANDRKLYNYDNENEKFIIFYKHDKNEYHGYHVDNEDEIPAKIRIELLAKNDV